MWKLSNFSANLILREINFSWFQRVKNSHYDHFSSSEFEFFEQFVIFSNEEFLTNQDSMPSKWIKWQFFTFWNQPKLISRKITVTGKLQNFHCILSLTMKEKFCDSSCGSRGSVYCCGIVVKYSYDIDKSRTRCLEVITAWAVIYFQHQESPLDVTP